MQAQEYIKALPIKPPVKFSTMFPYANPLAIDVLSHLVCFDPAKRITCEQALNHPYFLPWKDPIDQQVCASVSAYAIKNTCCALILSQKFDFSFEEEDSIDGMKRLIVEEVNAFRAEVRAQARAAAQIRRLEVYGLNFFFILKC